VIIDGQLLKKKNAVCKQLVPVEEASNNIPSIIQAGLRMSTNEFEAFVQSKLFFECIEKTCKLDF
jgi:hypothetical protein